MTNQEAIEILREKIFPCVTGDWKEAVGVAISALQAQDSPKPTAESVQNVQNEDLISRKAAIDALKNERSDWNCDYNVPVDHCIDAIYSVPSAQPEIIRCKDCKYRGGLSGFYCDIVEKAVGVDSFCSWAERRDDEQT